MAGPAISARCVVTLHGSSSTIKSKGTKVAVLDNAELVANMAVLDRVEVVASRMVLNKVGGGVDK